MINCFEVTAYSDKGSTEVILETNHYPSRRHGCLRGLGLTYCLMRCNLLMIVSTIRFFVSLLLMRCASTQRPCAELKVLPFDLRRERTLPPPSYISVYILDLDSLALFTVWTWSSRADFLPL
ncbi:hypothetical protein AVEN_210706-1 [Araneus ventricosus]|uniref:Uncharacterized protein n=1 Tax=Araneus ventricosus TaxID=182803 RepID=A0A4Y2V1R2_ARAVE|nr:hypothetical protein AVEN_210706-1 [Araneus ventricosus]